MHNIGKALIAIELFTFIMVITSSIMINIMLCEFHLHKNRKREKPCLLLHEVRGTDDKGPHSRDIWDWSRYFSVPWILLGSYAKVKHWGEELQSIICWPFGEY